MHREILGSVRTVAKRHRARFATFGVIGAAVFVMGLMLQALLVQAWHVGAVLSYVSVGIVSIQVSFTLNRWLTWRDRSIPFWVAHYRFNAQKAITSIINIFAYSALVHLGINYLVANVLTVTAFTLINYGLGNSWAFATKAPARASSDDGLPLPAPPRDRPLPSVSVVVPCRNNADTIRATVEALLRQDYPALEELVLVAMPLS